MKLILTFLALTGSALAAGEKPARHSHFFRCTQDKDCIAVEDVCPGHVSAINRHYKAAMQTYWRSIAPSIDCMAPPHDLKDLNDYKGFCWENLCRLKLKSGEVL